jgi:hypothetical protein
MGDALGAQRTAVERHAFFPCVPRLPCLPRKRGWQRRAHMAGRCPCLPVLANPKMLAHMSGLADMRRAVGWRRPFGRVRRTPKRGQQASLAPFGGKRSPSGGQLGGFAPMSAKKKGLAHMSGLADMRRAGGRRRLFGRVRSPLTERPKGAKDWRWPPSAERQALHAGRLGEFARKAQPEGWAGHPAGRLRRCASTATGSPTSTTPG